jgi:hypothetical protein
MSLRVGQWATGNIGKQALRAILAHPALELIGVVVRDPTKVGRDAAELCGLSVPTGILATDSGDALLALKPDCISYCAIGTAGRKAVATGESPGGALEDICNILSAGINVVSTSLVPLIHPPSAAPDMVAAVEAACRRGNASCLTSGLDPGFMHDLLPMTLSTICGHVQRIRISEIMSYGTWDKPEAIVGKFGFGQPLDSVPPILKPGILKAVWAGDVQMIAERFGLKLDRIEEFHELLPSPETFTIPAARIEKGTSAGMRFEVRGVVDERAVIIIEHVTRLRPTDAPHWPKAPLGCGGYRIEIEGEPSWVMELASPGHLDPTVPATASTALRLVNAIPAVCAAGRGVLTPFDLPHIAAPMASGRRRL